MIATRRTFQFGTRGLTSKFHRVERALGCGDCSRTSGSLVDSDQYAWVAEAKSVTRSTKGLRSVPVTISLHVPAKVQRSTPARSIAYTRAGFGV